MKVDVYQMNSIAVTRTIISEQWWFQLEINVSFGLRLRMSRRQKQEKPQYNKDEQKNEKFSPNEYSY
jgi:hypothetical protein